MNTPNSESCGDDCEKDVSVNYLEKIAYDNSFLQRFVHYDSVASNAFNVLNNTIILTITAFFALSVNGIFQVFSSKNSVSYNTCYLKLGCVLLFASLMLSFVLKVWSYYSYQKQADKILKKWSKSATGQNNKKSILNPVLDTFYLTLEVTNLVVFLLGIVFIGIFFWNEI